MVHHFELAIPMGVLLPHHLFIYAHCTHPYLPSSTSTVHVPKSRSPLLKSSLRTRQSWFGVSILTVVYPLNVMNAATNEDGTECDPLACSLKGRLLLSKPWFVLQGALLLQVGALDCLLNRQGRQWQIVGRSSVGPQTKR